MGIPTATASSSISASAPMGSSIKVGKIRMTPFSTPTARLRKAPSPSAKSGLCYAARQAGAAMADLLAGVPALRNWRSRQNRCGSVRAAFWCRVIDLCFALDAAKRLCRVRTSNAGQCLFTGIASSERARRVAATFWPRAFSGWGSAHRRRDGTSRFNPMAYHNGSIWPHDNALIAHGTGPLWPGRAGRTNLTGLFEAGMYFELQPDAGAFLWLSPSRAKGPSSIQWPVRRRPGRRRRCSSSSKRVSV